MEEIQAWNAFRKGDKLAFEKIFNDHIRILYKYGSRFTTDSALVEDCIQELFLDLWNKRDRIGDTDSVKRYLLGALRRRIIRKLQQKTPLNSHVDTENYDFQLEANLEEILINSELQDEKRRKVTQAFEKLSKRQKEVIYLKYYQELSYKEIEEALGINYQSVRNLLHNALKSIKAVLPQIINVIIILFINLFI
ncbi:MAG: RNA polymerase subunit sigma [Thalassobius sp.]|nr:RNA polymerase subunit sigma [Thalassovita sp.]